MIMNFRQVSWLQYRKYPEYIHGYENSIEATLFRGVNHQSVNGGMTIWNGSIYKTFTNIISMDVLVQVVTQLSEANKALYAIR